MTRIGQDTLNSAKTLDVGGKTYHYYDINAVADKGWGDLSKLPFSLKVLLENLLRHEDGESVTVEDIEGLVRWTEKPSPRPAATRSGSTRWHRWIWSSTTR